LEITPDGSILPCCKFQDQYYPVQYKIDINSIDDYRTSSMLREIKSDFENNVWPQGCERCQIEENNGIASKRILDYTRWKPHYDQYEIESNNLLTLSLAFGNVCNLKCIMCGPYSSSLWHKEYKDIYNLEFKSLKQFQKNLITDIIDISPNLVHMDIHGGEPLLAGIDEHKQLLDYYIENERAKDITIHYTTNGTVFPDSEWLERWSHFKEIEIQLSIDGVGARYEFIRYPAEWNTIVNNVKQYVMYKLKNANTKLSVAHTVSAYNILYLDEFVSWCASVGLPAPWLGRLHRPNHLRLSVWPKQAREFISTRLLASSRPEVQTWANLLDSDDSDLFPKFCEFTRTHSKYRNIDFDNIFPELTKYMI